MPQETRRPVKPQAARPQNAKPAHRSGAKPAQRPVQVKKAPSKKPLPPKTKPRAKIKIEEAQLETRSTHRRKSRRRLFALCFIISLVLVAIYWSTVAVLIRTRPDGNEDALPLLIFTQGKRKEDQKLEVEEAYVGNVKYLSVSFLEKYMDVAQFGDDQTRSFKLNESGEYATFYIGSEKVIINGIHTSIQEPAIIRDGDLCLPLDFFADKMNCFELGLNNATYGADVLTFVGEISPSFIVKNTSPSQPVPYDPAVHFIAPVETPTEETPTTA